MNEVGKKRGRSEETAEVVSSSRRMEGNDDTANEVLDETDSREEEGFNKVLDHTEESTEKDEEQESYSNPSEGLEDVMQDNLALMLDIIMRLREDPKFARTIYQDCPRLQHLLDRKPDLRPIFEDPKLVRITFERAYKSAGGVLPEEKPPLIVQIVTHPLFKFLKLLLFIKRVYKIYRAVRSFSGNLFGSGSGVRRGDVGAGGMGNQNVNGGNYVGPDGSGGGGSQFALNDAALNFERPEMKVQLDQFRMINDPEQLAIAVDSDPGLCALRDSNPLCAELMSDPDSFKVMIDPDNLRALGECPDLIQADIACPDWTPDDDLFGSADYGAGSHFYGRALDVGPDNTYSVDVLQQGGFNVHDAVQVGANPGCDLVVPDVDAPDANPGLPLPNADVPSVDVPDVDAPASPPALPPSQVGEPQFPGDGPQVQGDGGQGGGPQVQGDGGQGQGGGPQFQMGNDNFTDQNGQFEMGNQQRDHTAGAGERARAPGMGARRNDENENSRAFQRKEARKNFLLNVGEGLGGMMVQMAVGDLIQSSSALDALEAAGNVDDSADSAFQKAVGQVTDNTDFVDDHVERMEDNADNVREKEAAKRELEKNGGRSRDTIGSRSVSMGDSEEGQPNRPRKLRTVARVATTFAQRAKDAVVTSVLGDDLGGLLVNRMEKSEKEKPEEEDDKDEEDPTSSQGFAFALDDRKESKGSASALDQPSETAGFASALDQPHENKGFASALDETDESKGFSSALDEPCESGSPFALDKPVENKGLAVAFAEPDKNESRQTESRDAGGFAFALDV